MKKLLILISILLLMLLLILAAPSCMTEKIQTPSDEVTVQLKWIHQAQFAGLYVAEEKSYYAEENLKVNFLEGGKGTDVIESLTTGKADFAITSPEALIIKRSEGVPLKAVAAIYRRSPVAFVSMADSKIIHPKDLLGKTVSILGHADAEVQFSAMMKELNLDISGVELIAFNPDYTEFYNGDADVQYVYITAGLIKLRQQGYKLNIIWPGDYNVHFYSDILVCSDNLIAQNPTLVERFLRATLKGWQDAITDAEAAVAVVMKYVKVQDSEIQLKMMEAQIPLIHTGEDYIGWMKRQRWEDMYVALAEREFTEMPVDFTELYDMKFLEKIYGGKSK